MSESKLEVFQALGMIVLPQRAVAIGAIAMVQLHTPKPDNSQAITLTFVSGESLLLQETEVEDFLKQVNDAVMQMRYAAAQVQQGTRRILTH